MAFYYAFFAGCIRVYSHAMFRVNVCRLFDSIYIILHIFLPNVPSNTLFISSFSSSFAFDCTFCYTRWQNVIKRDENRFRTTRAKGEKTAWIIWSEFNLLIFMVNWFRSLAPGCFWLSWLLWVGSVGRAFFLRILIIDIYLCESEFDWTLHGTAVAMYDDSGLFASL